MSPNSETPRVAEMVVKVAVALSGAIPLVGGAVSGVSSAVVIVYDHLRARRFERGAVLIGAIADASGGDDELLARLEQDEQLEVTFVAAVEAAIRTGHEQKRRLIARSVIAAVNDPAKVDEAQLMVETLSQLDVPHIRALQQLEEEWERPRDEMVVSSGTSEVWRAELAPIKATLIRVGAARVAPAGLMALPGAPLVEGITKYGREILAALRAES